MASVLGLSWFVDGDDDGWKVGFSIKDMQTQIAKKLLKDDELMLNFPFDTGIMQIFPNQGKY